MARITECLSPDRFIKATVFVDDRSPTAFQFGCIMIVTDEAMGGPQDASGTLTASPIDADDRVRSYQNIDDVANEWDTTTAVFQAALVAFSQQPGINALKVGFVATYSQAEMQLLNECDSSCYAYVTPGLRDSASQLEIAAFIEARCKVYGAESNDPLTKDQTDTTNISEQLKQAGFNRTMALYHDDPDAQLATAFFAAALSNNFDNANSAYTGKFQRLAAVSAVPLSNTEIQAVTGYIPQVGLSPNQGHFANTFACHCDTPIFVEGNMASGRFFDTVHVADWLQKRIEEGICDLLTRTHVPYNDVGYQMQANVVSRILRQAQLAGVVAIDAFLPANDPIVSDTFNGGFVPGFEIEMPNVFNASSAQIANRVGQCITWTARLTGAFHSVCVEGTATVFSDQFTSAVAV